MILTVLPNMKLTVVCMCAHLSDYLLKINPGSIIIKSKVMYILISGEFC